MKKISFEFEISRWANFYFFVQNLSNWHFSNLEIYNKLWLEKTGPLSEVELECLEGFKKIRGSEPASNSIFEEAFYLSINPMEVIGKELTEKDIQCVEKTFKIFKTRFEKIYQVENQKLEAWGEVLEKNISHSSDDIQANLEIFYNEKIKEPKVLRCFLLMAPISHSGSFVADGFITQELSSFKIENWKEIIGTIWHETIHAYFDKFYFKQILTDLIRDPKERNVIKELTASSLLPLGILGEKYFDLPITNKIYRRYQFGDEVTEKIITLTREYIESSLIVDKDYILQLKRILN